MPARPHEPGQGGAGEIGPALVIGWKEYVAFPEWGIRRVKAKVDTGARTSALDVAEYLLTTGPDGRPVVRLSLALDRRHPENRVVVDTERLGLVVVRNSGGYCEERPLIETTVQLGPISRRIRLTVTNRTGMRFRMILGREALRDAFVVDVGKKYLLGRHGRS